MTLLAVLLAAAAPLCAQPGLGRAYMIARERAEGRYEARFEGPEGPLEGTASVRREAARPDLFELRLRWYDGGVVHLASSYFYLDGRGGIVLIRFREGFSDPERVQSMSLSMRHAQGGERSRPEPAGELELGSVEAR